MAFRRGRQLRRAEEGRRKLAAPDEISHVDKPDEQHATFTVNDLGSYLDGRKHAEETEAQAEKDRLQRLRELWARTASLVVAAIEMVNEKTKDHHIRLETSDASRFFNDANNEVYGYGVSYDLLSKGMPMFDGTHSFVVSEETLSISNIGTMELRLDGLSTHVIADAIAESVKSFLEG